jgi:hypothetical protein
MANNASISNISVDLTELSADTSPQLGGNLDLNSNNIIGTGNVNINGSITGQLFSGSGASLTNLNASNLSSGTIPDARFPSALPAVDGSNLTGINTDLVADTTPQLGGNLDTNGNDIEVGASDRITLGGIASGSYPEFQIKSTGSVNQLLAYDGQIDFGRPSGGPFKLKLSQPSGAGGTSIELNSNTTGGHQRIDAAQTAIPFELQYGGSTKINIGSSAVAVTGNLTTTGTITPGTYRAGEIIEQLETQADGNSVTVQSGTYSITDVTAVQNLTTTHAVINGSSIDYVPPTGTTRVIYEFWVFMRDTDVGPILHFAGRVAGTQVTNSRHTWRAAYASADYQMWIYSKMILRVGVTESLAAGDVGTWTSAKTLDFTSREYSSSYEGRYHQTNHWDGGGTDIIVKPRIRITAIA